MTRTRSTTTTTLGTARNVGLALALGAALATAAGAPAIAQDTSEEDAAKAADLAAETAYLRAYFDEREAKDPAKAEKAYAAVAVMNGARREIVAKALLGRWRCLTALQRTGDATELAERLRTEFKDVAEVKAAVAAPIPATGDLDADIGKLFDLGRGAEVARWGDRAVPHMAKRLRTDNPTVVETASDVLSMIGTDAAWAAIEDGLRDPSVLHAAWLSRAVRKCSSARTGVIDAALSRRDAPGLHESAASVVICDPSATPPTSELVSRLLALPGTRQAILKSNANTEADAAVTIAALSSDDKEVRAAGIQRLGRLPAAESKLGARLLAPSAEILAHDDSVQGVVTLVANRGDWQKVLPSRDLVRAAVRTGRGADALQLLLATRYAPGEADRTLFFDALRAVPLDSGSPNWSPNVQGADTSKLVALLGPRPSDDDFRLLMERWIWGDQTVVYLSKLQEAGSLDDARLGLALRSLRVMNSNGYPLAQVLDWVSARIRSGGMGDGAATVYMTALDRPEIAPRASGYLKAIQTNSAAGYPSAPAKSYARDCGPLAAWIRADAPTERQDAAIEYMNLAVTAGRTSAADVVRDALKPGHPRFSQLLWVAIGAKAPWAAEQLEPWAKSGAVEPAAYAWALTTLRGAASAPALAELLSSCPDNVVNAVVGSIVNATSVLGRAETAKLVLLAVEKRSGQFTPPRNPNASPTSQLLSEFAAEDRRRIATAALRSTSSALRTWGAFLQYHLRDPESWDLLLAAAKDGAPETREAARGALRAIEADRLALSDIETAARVRTLLAGQGTDERRAGIAGAVATRATTLVPELLRLAVEDKDPNVRADARAALVALGSIAPAAGAATAPAQPPK